MRVKDLLKVLHQDQKIKFQTTDIKLIDNEFVRMTYKFSDVQYVSEIESDLIKQKSKKEVSNIYIDNLNESDPILVIVLEE